MSNLPPMPYRVFRDEIVRDVKPAFERDGPSGEDHKPGRFEHDPYERCDFDEEED